ncbi:MAG: hypothetical protein H6679_02750 [Epsilonproteobacteria bacterium]|nr:hypothetical protein [Campylobacterota bacterium]
MKHMYFMFALALGICNSAMGAESSKDKKEKTKKDKKDSQKNKKRDSFEFNLYKMPRLEEDIKNRLFLVINAAHKKPDPLELLPTDIFTLSHSTYKIFEIYIPDEIYQNQIRILNFMDDKHHAQSTLRAILLANLIPDVIPELQSNKKLRGFIRINFYPTDTAAQNVFIKFFEKHIGPQSIFYFINEKYIEDPDYLEHLQKKGIFVFNHKGTQLGRDQEKTFRQIVVNYFDIPQEIIPKHL